MTESHVPWLVQLAQAGVTPPDLVKGVLGTGEVEGVSEIREFLREILSTGWVRRPKLEEDSCYNHKIEFHVYTKKFDHGRRWMSLTAFCFFGAVCKLETFDEISRIR